MNHDDSSRGASPVNSQLPTSNSQDPTPNSQVESEDGGGASPGQQPPDDGPLPSRKRWVLGALAALAVALFTLPLLRSPDVGRMAGGNGSATSPGGGPELEGVGACAASEGPASFDFTLKDMNGNDVQLADYKGKVVLLNFWATWCPPCRLEIPELVQLVDEHRDEGFEVLGVSIDDTPQQLRDFAQQMNMNYPSLLMREDLESAYGTMWALPTTFLIDRHGSICMKHMGPVTKDMVEREIKGLL